MAKLNELLVIILMTETSNLPFYLTMDFIKCFRWVTIDQVNLTWVVVRIKREHVQKSRNKLCHTIISSDFEGFMKYHLFILVFIFIEVGTTSCTFDYQLLNTSGLPIAFQMHTIIFLNTHKLLVLCIISWHKFCE